MGGELFTYCLRGNKELRLEPKALVSFKPHSKCLFFQLGLIFPRRHHLQNSTLTLRVDIHSVSLWGTFHSQAITRYLFPCFANGRLVSKMPVLKEMG